MIVWAGNNAGVINNTGGRYNPNSGQIDLPVSGAPSARSFPTAVWTGTEMIVWGGLESGSVSANTGGHFDSNNGWTATSTVNAPIGRYYHTAIWADTVMIVWGDRNKTGTGGVYFEPPDLVFADGFE